MPRKHQEPSRRPQYVSVEAHAHAYSETLRLLNALIEADYKKFNIVPLLEMSTTRCPSPAREGKYVEHTFPKGASGLFGRELSGPWLNWFDTIARFQPTLSKYSRVRTAQWNFSTCEEPLYRPGSGPYFPGCDNWYDIHATV